MREYLKIITWPCVVILLHLVLTYLGGYYWWTHVDTIMHVLGGMSIAQSAITAIELYSHDGSLRVSNKFIYVIIVMSFVSLAAVNWEFLEFTLDHIVGTHMQPSLADTMGDILAGLCGGIIISISKVRRSS